VNSRSQTTSPPPQRPGLFTIVIGILDSDYTLKLKKTHNVLEAKSAIIFRLKKKKRRELGIAAILCWVLQCNVQ
jgi:hypothetical protein